MFRSVAEPIASVWVLRPARLHHAALNPSPPIQLHRLSTLNRYTMEIGDGTVKAADLTVNSLSEEYCKHILRGVCDVRDFNYFFEPCGLLIVKWNERKMLIKNTIHISKYGWSFFLSE